MTTEPEIIAVEAQVQTEQVATTHWCYRMPCAGVKYYVYEYASVQDIRNPRASDYWVMETSTYH